MKILLVAPLPPPYGGIANWTLLLKDKMMQDDSIELIDIINIGTNKRDIDGRTIWDRIVVQGVSMFVQRAKIKKTVCARKPDVVHITTSGTLGVIRDLFFLKALKKLGVYSVYHIHFGRVPEIAKKNTNEWKLINKAISIASQTIVIDDKTNQTLLKKFGRNQIVQIPNPFDLSKLYFEEGIIRKEIMFLGWCIEAKGIVELLEAWDMLTKKYSDWTLRIVGPYTDEFKDKMCSEHDINKVIFDGEKRHSEAMKLLSHCSIFVLPSHTEAFPNVILEAMAYGKAIVATDVGAIPEMLGDECGIVVEPRDSTALASGLERLILDSHYANMCGLKARKKLEDKYEIDVVLEKLKKVWEKR